MLRKWLISLTNAENGGSLSAKLRSKRFNLFKSLFNQSSAPLKILDVGGRETIWVREGFCDLDTSDRIEITILNVKKEPTTAPNVVSVVGDARNMSQFADDEFDIVFSNSVIEHVGDYADQMLMAREVRRVGKKYFVQTPNLYFPIEPHFMYPCFQFLPLQLKVWILLNIGRRHRKVETREKALRIANEIKLLSKRDFGSLFPQATIFEEKIWGLTKSFIAYEN